LRQILLVLSCATAFVLTVGLSAASAVSHNITTVVGTGTASYSGDGGPATQAQISVPVSVVALRDGGYLVFQQGGSAVRRVLPDETITTVAGSGTTGYTGDGGPAMQATLNAPSGGAMTADGGY
jgi:hypothetical protein